MPAILVTGCAGFIGSNFLRYMLERHPDFRLLGLDALTYAGNPDNLRELLPDPRFRFVRGDVRDRALVAGLLAAEDPDFVIHFAAESHVDRSITGPEVFAGTNVLGTVNLLECCRAAWQDAGGAWRPGKRYLQVGTDEVYGALGPEGFFTEDSPLNPHSPYSASKAAADHFVLAYHDTYGLPAVITRCSNNYGPRQFPEKLIPLMITRALAHRPLPVYGDGLQVRDWLYVDDHCRAIFLALTRGAPGRVYNVGGHGEQTNLAIVRTILGQLRARTGDEAIGEELIAHVPDRLGHDRRYAIDPARIQTELGWAPEVPFGEGIARTVDWYLENPEWVERVVSGAYREES